MPLLNILELPGHFKKRFETRELREQGNKYPDNLHTMGIVGNNIAIITGHQQDLIVAKIA
jgi:hypothetical protein